MTNGAVPKLRYLFLGIAGLCMNLSCLSENSSSSSRSGSTAAAQQDNAPSRNPSIAKQVANSKQAMPIPMIKLRSADGQKTVTLAGAIHVAPTQFYNTQISKFKAEVAASRKTALILEGIGCTGGWPNVQNLVDAIPLSGSDLEEHFSRQDLLSAQQDTPSQAIQTYIISNVQKWLNNNNPQSLVDWSASCADRDRVTAGSGINSSYTSVAQELTQETGFSWVMQYGEDSPFANFLFPKPPANPDDPLPHYLGDAWGQQPDQLVPGTSDFDQSQMDVTDAQQLLWNIGYEADTSDPYATPAADADVDPWAIVKQLHSTLRLPTSNPIVANTVAQLGRNIDHAIVYYGRDHLPDLAARLEAQGYTRTETDSVDWDAHWTSAAANSLEAQFCAILAVGAK